MTQTVNGVAMIDDNIDAHVDQEIQQCLCSVPPKSFFMFAGAGSGKTSSLINTLKYIDSIKGKYLAEHGKQVAVITYTNAACDEINRRLQYKPIFHVSTIHSFLWELILNFQTDIKAWIRSKIESEINELQLKQERAGNITEYEKIGRRIDAKRERLEKLDEVRRFSYNPNDENTSFDSLSHEEVVQIGSEFIKSNPIMQKILVNKYPFFLIDESQDTKKELVDALLCVYKNHKDCWAIGMFGDSMQKIYSDGKDNLESAIPDDWVFPVKVMNHRSAKRIVSLANAIRSHFDDPHFDGKKQYPRTDANDGVVRLFIANSTADKERTEQIIAAKMYDITSDCGWNNSNEFKCLILEHHMAASRFSFENLFTPLSKCSEFSTALRKGEIPELSFLANMIAPLIKAYQNDDYFEITKILRKNSSLLSRKRFEQQPEKQKEMLKRAKQSAESLFSLWANGSVPTCIDVLKNTQESELFETSVRVKELLDDEYSGDDPKINALRKALDVPFDELQRYASYVTDNTQFATHQGVKGLEFPRVMVILDDAEARGFLFSYEKLFGVKPLTPTDLQNEKAGKDTSLRRTARLFYVACTRAIDSLAVVAYSKNPEIVKETAKGNGWFLEDEIVMIE